MQKNYDLLVSTLLQESNNQIMADLTWTFLWIYLILNKYIYHKKHFLTVQIPDTISFQYKKKKHFEKLCVNLMKLPACITFLSITDDVKAKGGRVLVHCRAGVSRSVTICLAYLMFTAKIRLEAAFEHVRSKRSMISPSLNFMRQLEQFEKELDSSISLSTSSSDISMASSMDSSRDISSSDSCSHTGFEFTMSGSITSPTTPLLLPS